MMAAMSITGTSDHDVIMHDDDGRESLWVGTTEE